MSLLRNKKAVEGLPLRYIIIALVAALVVGIALQFTGVLKVGILSTAEKINESTTTQTTCALDTEKPIIETISATCTSGNLTLNATITDDCGVKEAWFAKTGVDGTTSLTKIGTDDKSATWTFSGTGWSTGTYNVYARDKSNTEMMSSGKAYNVTCSS